MKSPSRKKTAERGQGGLRDRTGNNKSDCNFRGRIDANAEERFAELFDSAATLLAKSIFSNHYRSPDVARIEEAIRIVFQDHADFHRFKASVSRSETPILFEGTLQ